MLTDYCFADGVAAITMDDGKVNALSLAMLEALNDRLDRALADDAAVVLIQGRPGILSAGFDLAALQGGGFGAATMVRAGFELAERLLSLPAPVVIACPGHAVAMGAFLLLSGDARVGADGPFRIQANEVAIGLTMPNAAIEILRSRLTPAAFNRATVLAEPFAPAEALAAGFLDVVVAPDELEAAATGVARALAGLDRAAHHATKLRARAGVLADLRAAIDADVRLALR
jgi:enoyl-CoA hydratase